jgi:hypothetical protein
MNNCSLLTAQTINNEQLPRCGNCFRSFALCAKLHTQTATRFESASARQLLGEFCLRQNSMLGTADNWGVLREAQNSILNTACGVETG